MEAYMPDNKIDSVFRDKIVKLYDKELPFTWNKDSSWERLQRKKKKKLVWQFYYYAAALLIIGFLLGNFNKTGKSDSKKDETAYSASSFEEYQKRQKLAEIEARMSGNYYSTKICFACDDIIYQVIKEDRPVQFKYFQTDLN